MIATMKQGQTECECGNVYYYQSIRESIPCMKCGKMHKNNGESVPIVLPEELMKTENK